MRDGTVKEIGENYQLRFERELAHPIDKVWAFLTEPNKLKTWLADGEIDLRVGGRVFLSGDNIDSTVTALEPGRVLAYGWKTADWDGGIIRFELEPTSDGTRLHFTHEMPKLDEVAKRELIEKIEVPDGWDQLPSTLAGWHSIFDRLRDALDGGAQRSSLDWREAGEEALGEWRELNDHYKNVLASWEPIMATLYHQVWIDAPVSKVYEALATAEGLGRWWAPHTSTETHDRLVLAHTLPSEEHDEMQMEVLESTRDKRVEWQVISTHPKRSPASAWTGTHIVYELTERPSPGAWMGMKNEGQPMAVLDFRHEGWDEDNEFIGFCNSGWGMALDSLRRFCESQS